MTPDFVGRCEEDQLKLKVVRLKKELEDNESSYDKLFNEYKESRKEHEADILKINTDWFGYGDRMKAEGLVVGERRAIKRIRDKCKDCCLPIGGVCERHTDWELGLGEEEKK